MSRRVGLVTLTLVVLAMGLALSGLGCAHECPVCATCPAPVTCPTCPEAPPPTPVATGPEQWVHLPVRINFATGGAALDSEAQMMIQQAVATLRARPDVVRIRVEGHTDSRGPDASNDQLSLERAQAVVNYMVTLGVSPNILEAQGFGATQPITSDTREMDRAQNRRVEFSVLARGAGMTPAPTYP